MGRVALKKLFHFHTKMNNLAQQKWSVGLSCCKRTGMLVYLFEIITRTLIWISCFCSELQKLHKQFVMGGVLSETEFWATRKVSSCLLNETCMILFKCNINFMFTNEVQKLLDVNNTSSSRKAKQKVGLKSDMIFNVKPSSDGQVCILSLHTIHSNSYVHFLHLLILEPCFCFSQTKLHLT